MVCALAMHAVLLAVTLALPAAAAAAPAVAAACRAECRDVCQSCSGGVASGLHAALGACADADTPRACRRSARSFCVPGSHDTSADVNSGPPGPGAILLPVHATVDAAP